MPADLPRQQRRYTRGILFVAVPSIAALIVTGCALLVDAVRNPVDCWDEVRQVETCGLHPTASLGFSFLGLAGMTGVAAAVGIHATRPGLPRNGDGGED